MVKEIKKTLEDIFYDYMAKGGVEETHRNYNERISKYEETLKVCLDNSKFSTIGQRAKELQELRKELETSLKYLKNGNIENQKKAYKETRDIGISRTMARISLMGRISPRYNDTVLEVIFYDDICTPKGKYEQYRTLKSIKDRIQFIKDNTEITHMSIVHLSRNYVRTQIMLKGKAITDKKIIDTHRVVILGEEFADFENLSEESIRNYKFDNANGKESMEWLLNKLNSSYSYKYNHLNPVIQQVTEG